MSVAERTGVEAMRLVLKGNNLNLIEQSLAGTNGLPLAQALGNTGEKAILPLLKPVLLDPTRALTAAGVDVRPVQLGGYAWARPSASPEAAPGDLAGSRFARALAAPGV